MNSDTSCAGSLTEEEWDIKRRLGHLNGTEYSARKSSAVLNCLTRKRANGKTENYHCLLSATLVAPGHCKVVPLMPEFVATQDGIKQDCERNPIKRWFDSCSPSRW